MKGMIYFSIAKYDVKKTKSYITKAFLTGRQNFFFLSDIHILWCDLKKKWSSKRNIIENEGLTVNVKSILPVYPSLCM